MDGRFEDMGDTEIGFTLGIIVEMLLRLALGCVVSIMVGTYVTPMLGLL